MSSGSQVQRVPREELDRKGPGHPISGPCLAIAWLLASVYGTQRGGPLQTPAPPRPGSGVRMKETE